MSDSVIRGLGPRGSALDRLASSNAQRPLDLLVVGGGITGAGIALDAAGRGFVTGLIERNDFASGTSSKSSKLIHGGLRYLEQRDFSLVREASVERELLARLAPHLVEPIPFVIPVSKRSVRAKFGVGLWTYDALASFKNLHVHRYLEREEAEARVPALPRGKVRGAFLFYDSKTDDVRLVMESLVQARRLGATVVNHCEVLGLEGSDDGCRATVVDGSTGATFEIAAKRIVVAAGVWGDRVEALANTDAEARLRPSKGIHLVFRRESIPLAESAAFIPDAEHRRMLFVIPWIDAILVGTTDTPYEGNLDRPSVESQDRAYVLDALNAAFSLDLSEDDIAGAYAGLRPLIAGKAGQTADLSRRHAVYDIAPGIIGITGGKMTTFRRMAVDAVDRIANDLGADTKTKTRWGRLGSSDVSALRQAVNLRAGRLGVDPASAANLVRAYGDRSLEVLDIAEEHPELTQPVVPDRLLLGAEIAYCVQHEMACNLDDLLARRARLAITDRPAGLGENSRVVDVMGAELGWDEATRSQQIESYLAAVTAERGMPPAPSRPVDPHVDARSDIG